MCSDVTQSLRCPRFRSVWYGNYNQNSVQITQHFRYLVPDACGSELSYGNGAANTDEENFMLRSYSGDSYNILNFG